MIKGTIKVTDDLGTVDTSDSDEESQDELPPSIYGDNLSQVSTDRLIKKTIVSDNIQTINVRRIGYELEPLIIVANKNMNIKVSLDLRVFNNYDDKFEIINSDTKESIAGVNGLKGVVTIEAKLNKTGKVAIANSSNVLTVIQVVDDIKTVDLEKIRGEYFSK